MKQVMVIPLGQSVQAFPALLVVGGVAAASRLVASGSRPVQSVLNGLGFILGIGLVVVLVEAMLSRPVDTFTIVVSLLAGLLLVVRPIRNIRWAALLALGSGILVGYFVWTIFGVTNQTILGAIAAVTIFVTYVALKFAEDIIHALGGILSFPPIAIVIGLTASIHGVLLMLGSGLPQVIHSLTFF